MSLGTTLRDWVAGVSLGASEYTCFDCGAPVKGTDDRCPECAGDLTALESEPDRDWDPLR